MSGTKPKDDYREILQLASQICECPIVSLVIGEQQYNWWSEDITGWDSSSFEQLTSLPRPSNGIIYGVENTLNDESVSNHHLVTGATSLRSVFCLCSPDATPENPILIFVAHIVPKVLTLAQQQMLFTVCAQAVKNYQLETTLIATNEKRCRDYLGALFYSAIDAVSVTDAGGIIMEWNAMAGCTFGLSAQEVMGKSIFDTIGADDDLSSNVTKFMHSNPTFGSETFELHCERKDGAKLNVALGISPAIVDDKHLFVFYMRDITHMKAATSELDKQKEFYENILNALPTDIVVFDPDHRYIFVNPGAIKDAEHRKFIIGKDDFEYCEYRNRDKSLAQLRRDMFLEVKNQRKEIRWEDTVRDPEGNPFTSLRRIFPVYDENDALKMVIGFGLDITDRKILEEKQELLVKQLSLQNTQLVDFCNIVSHNLRAPLVNMSMLVEYIQESETEEEKNDLISKLQPVLESLHTTFNELVESIQIKQNFEIQSEFINITDCLKRVSAEYEMEVMKTGAKITMDFEAVPVIYFPHKYLFSIFQNLLSNALKYSSPKRKPDIIFKTTKTNDNILLTVSDNGLGVDLDKHKENFFKIGKVFHRHPNSKGFGLFMTKTQVEAMDGQIWVESTPDVGTTFFIEFKFKRP